MTVQVEVVGALRLMNARFVFPWWAATAAFAVIVTPPTGRTHNEQVWLVERTFAWLGLSRRLAKDHERLPETGEAMILWSMSRIMLRRLAGAAH